MALKESLAKNPTTFNDCDTCTFTGNAMAQLQISVSERKINLKSPRLSSVKVNKTTKEKNADF